MAKAHAKRQEKKKTTRSSRVRGRGATSRRPSTRARTGQAPEGRVGTALPASRPMGVAEKLGISNHPLTEEVERQRLLPPRGTQRKKTPAGHEVKRPVEPAPVRRRGRGEDLEMPAEE
jgi:hypothetical protein